MALAHVIDGARPLLRQEGERLAVGLLFRQAPPVLLAVGMVPPAQHGGGGTGPRALGVADVRAGGAHAVAGGVFRPRDQATIRGEVLPPWAAVHRMDVVEPHEAQECAHTRDGWPQGPGVGLVLRGGLDEGEGQSTEALSLIGEEGEVDLDGLVHSRRVTALGDALAVGCVSEVRAARRPVILARGLLAGRSAFRALAPPGQAASESIKALHLTAYSVRSCVAPASGSR